MNKTAEETELGRPVANHSRNVAGLRLSKPVAMNVSGLFKSYRKGRNSVEVLKGVDLEINEGGFTAVVGQSGSGKSTLLHLLGTLDVPDAGEVWFEDTRIDNLPARHKEYLRNQKFGMIFQFYHLLPELTTLENVLVPRMVQNGIWSYWRNRKKYKQRAMQLLEVVGLSDRLHHRPSQLSGGEMQRTAIARALISKPAVLLADEPTGNLDRENGTEVMNTLFDLQRQENLTIVMVTHDSAIAAKADHVIRLVDGRVQAAIGS